MIFKKTEVLNIISKIEHLVDKMVTTPERIAIRLKSGTIVEYIWNK